MTDQNRYGQGIITWSIVIMRIFKRRENILSFVFLLVRSCFLVTSWGLDFSIREGIRGRAVENCPIVPTDLTFHRYWTISYNSTFTLLTEQHGWPCCNLDFLWFVCLHQTQNVTHSCKILLSLPLEKVKNNIAQGRCSISKIKSAFFGIFQPIALHWQRLWFRIFPSKGWQCSILR